MKTAKDSHIFFIKNISVFVLLKFKILTNDFVNFEQQVPGLCILFYFFFSKAVDPKTDINPNHYANMPMHHAVISKGGKNKKF